MASKRKRQSESSTPRRNKRVRHTHKAGELSHPAQQGKTSNSDEVYHIIKDILDENENQYLIDWEGLDPKTGRSYKPSWVSAIFYSEECAHMFLCVQSQLRLQWLPLLLEPVLFIQS